MGTFTMSLPSLRKSAGTLLAVFLMIVVVAHAQVLPRNAIPANPPAQAEHLEKAPLSHPGRPRIGLVLEGGGALGFAHIGVIRWLEQNHIPVDYVAGTSMGGLVGGLYAAGNNPDQLERIVKNIDWPVLLNGQVPFNDLSFRRKEDKLAYPNRLDFGLRHGLGLPSGLNPGGGVSLVFTQNLLPYYNLGNFDQLPIPFRCVATDLVKGEKKVFDSGSLPQALRATMSIPGLFAPVPIGEAIYVDGMAVDNLPVDVARNMGADVIISVYLNTGKVDPATLTSILNVAAQNLSIMVSANEKLAMQDSTVLINADVSKFGSTEFMKGNEIIPLGEKAAQNEAADLRKFSLNDADWNEYLAQRNAKIRTDVPVPQFITIATKSDVIRRELETAFRQFQGKKLDSKLIEKAIVEAEGTGYFSSINYTLVRRGDQVGLEFYPTEKHYAPPFLNVGLTLDGNDSNNIRFGASGRITAVNIVGPQSEWRTDLSAGLLAGAQTELYRPFVKNPAYFAAARGYFTHSLVDLYNNGSQLAEYKRTRNGVGVDVGRNLGTRSQIRIGQDYQWYKLKRTIGQDLQQEFELRPAVTSAHYRYYGEDSPVVPLRGTMSEVDFNRYNQRPGGVSGGFQQVEGNIAHFYPVRPNGSIVARLQAGTSFNGSDLGLAGLTLGGPFRLSAYERYELRGSRYFLAQAGYNQRLVRLNPILGDALYVIGLAEVGKADVQGTGSTLPMDVAGAVVAKTIIGPVFFGGSIGDSGHRKWFFGINRIF